MKVLLIGHGRSKTNYCLSLISDYYKLENLGEIYKECVNRDSLLKITSDLKNKNDFVIKIDACLLSVFQQIGVSFNMLDLDIYDKIYTIRRENISDTVASLKIAKHTNFWVYDEITPVPKHFDPVTIDPETDQYIFESVICGYKQLNKIESYMDENSYTYTQLKYETVEQYADKNWLGATSKVIESKYNYSKMITNYDSIIDMYYSTWCSRWKLL